MYHQDNESGVAINEIPDSGWAITKPILCLICCFGCYGNTKTTNINKYTISWNIWTSELDKLLPADVIFYAVNISNWRPR